MAGNKTRRYLRRRHAGSRGPLGGYRAKISLGQIDQPGPGRTGLRVGAGEFETVEGSRDPREVGILEDCGGRTRVGGSEGDGVLADLGVSSMQLDQSARGFSFREAGPLDMRMDAEGELTADEIVNQWSEKEIADLLYREADEHDSRRIAKAIVRARPLRDTAHLATTVAGARKQWGRQRLHPATKTFLALRIAVNREMEELGQFLSRTPATINPGGRWVVLSYHSREDRLVKHAFQKGERAGTLRVLTRHVIQPSEAEQANNPRSRSAKLRCAKIVAAD